jgi:HK97 gp10 family phage protein
MAISYKGSVMTMQGMDGLIRALKSTPDIAKDVLRDAVDKTSFAIAQRMKVLAPRGTGRLISEIHYQPARGLRGGVSIGADAWYWHFLEYGTVKLPAKRLRKWKPRYSRHV